MGVSRVSIVLLVIYLLKVVSGCDFINNNCEAGCEFTNPANWDNCGNTYPKFNGVDVMNITARGNYSITLNWNSNDVLVKKIMIGSGFTGESQVLRISSTGGNKPIITFIDGVIINNSGELIISTSDALINGTAPTINNGGILRVTSLSNLYFPAIYSENNIKNEGTIIISSVNSPVTFNTNITGSGNILVEYPTSMVNFNSNLVNSTLLSNYGTVYGSFLYNGEFRNYGTLGSNSVASYITINDTLIQSENSKIIILIASSNSNSLIRVYDLTQNGDFVVHFSKSYYMSSSSVIEVFSWNTSTGGFNDRKFTADSEFTNPLNCTIKYDFNVRNTLQVKFEDCRANAEPDGLFGFSKKTTIYIVVAVVGGIILIGLLAFAIRTIKVKKSGIQEKKKGDFYKFSDKDFEKSLELKADKVEKFKEKYSKDKN